MDENNLSHVIDTDLSTKDSLVLLSDDNKVKIAYRGTDLKNLKRDVVADLAIAVGQEQHTPAFKDAELQIQRVKQIYGKPDELL